MLQRYWQFRTESVKILLKAGDGLTKDLEMSAESRTFVSSITTKSITMKASVKLKKGMRVKVTGDVKYNGKYNGMVGTVIRNRAQSWVIKLDGIDYPVIGELYGKPLIFETWFYKKHLELA